MQRYFLNENAERHQLFFITNEEDIHHIRAVMRMAEGESVIINFKEKRTFEAKIISIENTHVEIETTQELSINSELPVKVTICSGLIKSDKYEWLLQKATELGASHFISTHMERSVVKLNDQKAQKKCLRWQKIVKEAAEQSYRQLIPDVEFISKFSSIYDMISQYDYVLMAYEETAKQGETALFKKKLQEIQPGSTVLMMFGPEGGFSPNEINDLHDKVTYVGLGPRILRAETAPLYALSALSYEFDLN
ncbi:16S rRNA (uracil(1498)-N(3))-methyltransferase [Staphylococcus chromogenes]|uniref:16S rRNA (uracil(1498)-N(3))-methyltransferase n=1 Tax=Staphylococcus chromogenes TaxID=46126 RepID=UPI003AFF9A71